MAVADTMGAARRWFDNLTDRERRMVGLLGLVLALFAVLLPSWLLVRSVGELEDRNAEVQQALRALRRARGTLAQREAERKAAEARYRRKAPPLGSFLEAKAGEFGITIREAVDQPEKDFGEFRRRHVRVTLPNVDIAAFVKMVASVRNSPYPVAIERIQIDHFGDRFNAQLGVYAYDRKGGKGGEDAKEARDVAPKGGRAGPPAP